MEHIIHNEQETPPRRELNLEDNDYLLGSESATAEDDVSAVIASEQRAEVLGGDYTSNEGEELPQNLSNSMFNSMLSPTSRFNATKNTVLVLFHTYGEYEDDWVPMTPGPNLNSDSSCKWNGQRQHGSDYLLLDYGTNAIILERERKTDPYTFTSVISNGIIMYENAPKGTPKKYILNGIITNAIFNGIVTGTQLTRPSTMRGSGSFQRAALNKLNLTRIEGKHLSGIQLCKNCKIKRKRKFNINSKDK
jgi:hypothetical protein